MNVVKVKLLLATLLSSLVGTVGCATGQSFTTLSPNSNQAVFDVDQLAMQSTTDEEIESARVANKPPSPTAINPTGTFEQVANASFAKTVTPTPNVKAVAPLITLSPNDDLLNMVEQASGVVLLDFYADWCGPCRTQGGILHEMELTAEQNQASIIKIDVDQHRRLATAFNVTSMPTLILIKDGLIIERQTGVANHQQVASLLSR